MNSSPAQADTGRKGAHFEEQSAYPADWPNIRICISLNARRKNYWPLFAPAKQPPEPK
jgi:hypothetical protein